MSKERNGIVNMDDMFNIGHENEMYAREENIIPMSGTKEEDDVMPKEEDPEDDLDLGINRNDEDEDKHLEEKPLDKKPEEKDTDVRPSQIDYKDIITKLSSRGILSSLDDVIFENEEGEEIPFSEMELSSEEDFYNVIETVLQNQKEDMMQGKIDVSSVSEFTKKLIQADKSGADVVSILKQYDKVQAPLEKLNIEDKGDQLRIIRHYIGTLGLPKDESEEFYKSIMERGDDFVEAKAIKYKAELQKILDAEIQQSIEKAEADRKQAEEDFKKYKKALKSSITEKYQLSDSMVTKVMDYAIKADEKNKNVSRAIEKARQMLLNPEEAPDLIMFLMNPDEFIKQKSNKKVTEEKKRIFKMVSQSSKDKRRAPIDDKGDDLRGMSFDEIELKD